METDDIQLGPYVYCASHVGPHMSGWCTVPISQKLGLLAADLQEAGELVIHLGLPWHGYCGVCYKWIANQRPGDRFCNDGSHTQEEIVAANVRAADLRGYLWERALDAPAKTV